MWTLLLNNWNSLSLFYDDLISTLDLHLFTDASHLGFDGIFWSQRFYSTWPNEIGSLPLQLKSSSLLELYPIVIVPCSGATIGH